MSSTLRSTRSIGDVIQQILAVLPNPIPPSFENNLIVLSAELHFMLRLASYTPPESQTQAEQWAELERVLYRYMPPPTATDWALAVSNIVLGVSQ